MELLWPSGLLNMIPNKINWQCYSTRWRLACQLSLGRPIPIMSVFITRYSRLIFSLYFMSQARKFLSTKSPTIFFVSRIGIRGIHSHHFYLLKDGESWKHINTSWIFRLTILWLVLLLLFNGHPNVCNMHTNPGHNWLRNEASFTGFPEIHN